MAHCLCVTHGTHDDQKTRTKERTTKMDCLESALNALAPLIALAILVALALELV